MAMCLNLSICARGGNRGQQSPYAVCHKALQRPCSMTSESSSSGSSFGFSLHGKDMGGEGSPQPKGENLRLCRLGAATAP